MNNLKKKQVYNIFLKCQLRFVFIFKAIINTLGKKFQHESANSAKNKFIIITKWNVAKKHINFFKNSHFHLPLPYIVHFFNYDFNLLSHQPAWNFRKFRPTHLYTYINTLTFVCTPVTRNNSISLSFIR